MYLICILYLVYLYFIYIYICFTIIIFTLTFTIHLYIHICTCIRTDIYVLYEYVFIVCLYYVYNFIPTDYMCCINIYIYIFELFTIYSERWILVRFPKQTWGSIFHVGVLASSVRVVLVLVSASSVWISQQRLNLFIIQTYQYKMG